jgi:putative endonuclease
MMHYVYVLRSMKDGRLYVGYTGDLRRRLTEHNAGVVPSTRCRLPFKLIYYEACTEEADALKRERYLKTTYGKRYIRGRVKSDPDAQLFHRG